LSLPEPLRSLIMSQFISAVGSRSRIAKELMVRCDIGKEIDEKLTNSRLGNLSLTSVGQVIGILYFERVLGESMDLEIWIN